MTFKISTNSSKLPIEWDRLSLRLKEKSNDTLNCSRFHKIAVLSSNFNLKCCGMVTRPDRIKILEVIRKSPLS